MSRAPEPLPVETLLDNADGMRRLARQLVHDDAEADDVTQDAMVRALHKGPRQAGSSRAWLFGLVRNVARERRRAGARRGKREHAARRDHVAPSAAQTVIEVAEHRRVLQLLAELPEPYRTALWSRHFRDLPPRDIAKESGVPVETVRTWLKRGHQRLRERLDATDAQGGRAWRAALMPCLGAAGGRSVDWGGGLAMASATKSGVLGALVLVALGVGAWLVLQLDPSPRESTGHGDSQEVATSEESRVSSMANPGLAAPPASSVVGTSPAAWAARVLEADGAPVSDAQVLSADAETRSIDAFEVLGTTGADGRLTWPRAADKQIHQLAARAPDGRSVVVAPGDTGRELILRLPALPVDVVCVRSLETDQPLEGVTCELLLRDSGRTWMRSVITGIDGVALLAPLTGHHPTPWRGLRIRHDGYVPHAESSDAPEGVPRPGTPSAPRSIWLRPSAGLRVRVVDMEKNPVPGARVEGWCGSNPELQTGRLEFAHLPDTSAARDTFMSLGAAVTDSEGRALLASPPADESIALRAVTDGAVGLLLPVSMRGRARDPELVVRLRPACFVRGRVLDHERRPVEGAHVQVTPAEVVTLTRGGGRASVPHPATIYGFQSVSAADGTFALGPVAAPGGDLPLAVSALRGDLGGTHATVASSNAQGDLDVELVFPAPGERHRVVVTDATGTPVADAVAYWGNLRPGARTDGDGCTWLAWTQAPASEIHIVAEGWAQAHVPVDPTGTTHITLRRPSTLSGTLVDANQRPVEGRIEVWTVGGDGAALGEHERTFSAASGRTSPEGVFELSGLPPPPWRVKYWHTARRADGSRYGLAGELVLDTAGEVQLVLPEQSEPAWLDGVVEGSVVSAGGEVLTRFHASLRCGEQVLQPTASGRRFRFEGVAAGDWLLSVASERGEQQAFLPVHVSEAASFITVPVRLAVGRDVALRFVAPDGAAVGDARASCSREQGDGGGEVTSDSDGIAVLRRALPGAHRLQFYAPLEGKGAPFVPDAPSFVVPDAMSEPIPVRLLHASRLILLVDDDRFWPAARLTEQPGAGDDRRRHGTSWSTSIRILRDDGTSLLAAGLWSGRSLFMFSVPPGSYTVTIRAPGVRTFEGTFVARPGEDSEVPVRFE